jgi:GNAT superfamily N-acetyltransferase
VTAHPLAELLGAAADGRPPQPDGGWQRVPPWRPGVEAVLAFTGHAVLAVADDVSDRELDELGVDGIGGAHHPRVLLALAGREGWVDSLDLVLAARRRPCADRPPEAPAPLVDRPDLTAHPRVRWAGAVRDDVRVLGYAEPGTRSVATLSRGIGGLTELSLELEEAVRGRGLGAAFVHAALAAAPPGELVLAAVAPGNVASLRAFLTAGFAPVASVQLLRPRRGPA